MSAPAEPETSPDTDEITRPELADLVLVGRYELEYLLGRGGNGAVFGAYDQALQREVAIKLFGEHTPPAQIRHEALSLALLSHPNIVALHDLGDHDGHVFLVMDIVHGQSMWKHMQRRIAWRELVSLFMQAGEGLAEAHRAGIAHGDVKPGNILVAQDGRVLLTDFGLARVMLEPYPVDDRRDGTRDYMAPERLQGQPADPSSDQFSFCVSLWQALYRSRPWPSNTTNSIATAQPAKAWTRWAIPAELERLLRRGLSIDPRARFESMDALVDALAQVLMLGERRRLRLWMTAVSVASSASTAALFDLLGRFP